MSKQNTGKKVSKGIHSTVSKKNKVGRRDRTEAENVLNKWNAFLKGRRVWFRIANPDPQQRNKRFIRVLGSELYGDFRKYRFGYNMFQGATKEAAK